MVDLGIELKLSGGAVCIVIVMVWLWDIIVDVVEICGRNINVVEILTIPFHSLNSLALLAP